MEFQKSLKPSEVDNQCMLYCVFQSLPGPFEYPSSQQDGPRQMSSGGYLFCWIICQDKPPPELSLLHFVYYHSLKTAPIRPDFIRPGKYCAYLSTLKDADIFQPGTGPQKIYPRHSLSATTSLARRNDNTVWCLPTTC